MLFKAIKKKFADEVKAIITPQICNLQEELRECQRREQEYLQKIVLLEENVRNNNAVLDAFQSRVRPEIIDAKLETIKNEIRRLKDTNVVTANAESVDGKADSSKQTENTYDNIDYFSFENYFRGSEELIRRRQEIYLPYFEGSKQVLDLGCGRGEFLELLKEHGIPATGVDFYEEFTIYGRNKGLNIIVGDAIAYLKELPEKVEGIFAGQLVEHLAIEQIIALCKNAYDKLEEGKYLIMETPNPTSLAIYTHAFYIDPSHQRPVHPLTLKYFAEKAGFSDVQILFTESSRLEESIPELRGAGIDNLNEFNESMQKVADYLYGSQDYAIIAKK